MDTILALLDLARSTLKKHVGTVIGWVSKGIRWVGQTLKEYKIKAGDVAKLAVSVVGSWVARRRTIVQRTAMPDWSPTATPPVPVPPPDAPAPSPSLGHAARGTATPEPAMEAAPGESLLSLHARARAALARAGIVFQHNPAS